jgi:hypothetical protein
MKKLIAGALLFALSGVTSIARAEFAPEPRPVVARTPAKPAAQPAAPAPTSEAEGYAAREAATPALGDFEGGHSGGLYIGGGAVTVLLIVLLIILIV